MSSTSPFRTRSPVRSPSANRSSMQDPNYSSNDYVDERSSGEAPSSYQQPGMGTRLRNPSPQLVGGAVQSRSPIAMGQSAGLPGTDPNLKRSNRVSISPAQQADQHRAPSPPQTSSTAARGGRGTAPFGQRTSMKRSGGGGGGGGGGDDSLIDEIMESQSSENARSSGGNGTFSFQNENGNDSFRDTDAMSVSSGASSNDDMQDMISMAVQELKIIGEDGRLLEMSSLIQQITASVSHAIRSLCPVAVLVMDSNCMVMDINPKAEEILGLAREQIAGKNINMIMPQEVAVKHDDYVASYIKRYAEKRGPPKSSIVGTKTPREVFCKRFVDGKPVNFAAEVSVRGIPHPAGRQHPPLFFIGYIEDVTARKELREALQINTFIRDATDSALIVMNDFGKIIEFNTAAAHMFRYDPMFVRGHNVKKLMPPDIAVTHDEMLRRFRERVTSGLLHTSPIVGKTRTLFGYRPKFDEDGCERFKIELRVESFSGGKILVAFIRDINSSASESDFMMKTTSDTFPEHTVDRLMRGEAVWDRMENTTLLFSDVEAFSHASASMEPEEVFNFINEMVSSFDEMGFGMEKIKTIGDGYMAYFKSADDAIYTSLRMMEWSRENNVRIRIGLHTGTVVSGVVGKKRRTFDMWGDVVNTAKRMEETGTSCQLQISAECFDSIKNPELRDLFAETKATVKSKGVYTTYITRFPDDEMPEIVSTLIADREMEQREQESMVNARKQRMTEYM